MDELLTHINSRLSSFWSYFFLHFGKTLKCYQSKHFSSDTSISLSCNAHRYYIVYSHLASSIHKQQHQTRKMQNNVWQPPQIRYDCTIWLKFTIDSSWRAVQNRTPKSPTSTTARAREHWGILQQIEYNNWVSLTINFVLNSNLTITMNVIVLLNQPLNSYTTNICQLGLLGSFVSQKEETKYKQSNTQKARELILSIPFTTTE